MAKKKKPISAPQRLTGRDTDPERKSIALLLFVYGMIILLIISMVSVFIAQPTNPPV